MKKLEFKKYMDSEYEQKRHHLPPKKDWFRFNTETFKWYEQGAYAAWIYLNNVRGREIAKLKKEVQMLRERLGEY